MSYLKTAGSALLSVAVLFLLTRLMGKRQISQLGLFDYITGITLGSIAAELATELEDILKPLIAMAVYGLVALAISTMTDNSVRLRRFFNGKPVVLFEGGGFNMNNMRRGKIDVNEFLCCARSEGYFNLGDIRTAVLETNGRISFLPHAAARPLTPRDTGDLPADEQLLSEVIIDGEFMADNLRLHGVDVNWLRARLEQKGVASAQIALATLDTNKTLGIYLKYPK